MTTSGFGVTDRRMAIGGGLALAAGLALPLRQSRTVIQRGMVGGGLSGSSRVRRTFPSSYRG